MRRLGVHHVSLGILAGLLVSLVPAHAQIPFAFKFKEGVPVTYRTRQERTVELKQDEGVEKLVSVVTQLKRWNVLKVDSLGVATLELSIEELTLEQTDSSGETLRFDSTDLPGSNEDLAEQLKSVVGRPIVQVQMDTTGVVKDFKHLTQRNDVLRELPFLVTVPNEKLPVVGTSWRRDYPILIEPPIATPTRTLRAAQNCKVTESNSQRLVVEVKSELIEEVKEPKMMIPVLQFLPKGEVVFDPKLGKMIEAKLTVDETVPDIQGPGSFYKFTSNYVETIVDDVQQADKRN